LKLKINFTLLIRCKSVDIEPNSSTGIIPRLFAGGTCIVMLCLLQQQIRTDTFRLTHDSHLQNRSLYKAQLIVTCTLLYNILTTTHVQCIHNIIHNNNTLCTEQNNNNNTTWEQLVHGIGDHTP